MDLADLEGLENPSKESFERILWAFSKDFLKVPLRVIPLAVPQRSPWEFLAKVLTKIRRIIFRGFLKSLLLQFLRSSLSGIDR